MTKGSVKQECNKFMIFSLSLRTAREVCGLTSLGGKRVKFSGWRNLCYQVRFAHAEKEKLIVQGYTSALDGASSEGMTTEFSKEGAHSEDLNF